MKIYEIGGIDNSGKTTQIRELRKKLNPETVFVPPSLVQYTSKFPQTLKERVEWYSKGEIEDIVVATFVGANNRVKEISNREEDYVLLDRGYLTLNASLIARVMLRTKKEFSYAKDFVKEIRNSSEYDRHENASFLLFFDTDDWMADIEKREGDKFHTEFKDYLFLFNECLNRIHHKYENVMALDAQYDPEKITGLILGEIL
jgi:thymidylate kinase